MSNDDDGISSIYPSDHLSVKVRKCDKRLIHLPHPSQVKRCRIDGCDDESESDGSDGEAWKLKDQYAGFSLIRPSLTVSGTDTPHNCSGTYTVEPNTTTGADVVTLIPTYTPNGRRDNDIHTNITPLTLWNDCISQRKPCVIHGLPVLEIADDCRESKLLLLDKEQLVRAAGQELVQVERRLDAQETFGQARSAERQLTMKVQDFCQALDQSDGHLLYLSTQQPDDDSNDDSNVGRPTVTTPCKQLIDNKIIPDTLSWAGNLILQSCNLWMGTNGGASQTGTSSGLHHDFHDNFYILLHGSKTLRLFSPDCAPHMNTYGEIHRIHPNGLISYVGSETRPDGLPLEEATDDHDDTDDEQHDTDEEEMYGKGFGQESGSDTDGDEGDNFPAQGARDDFDEMCRQADDSERKPNNFSRIDLLGRSLEELRKEHEAFSYMNESVVHLKAGQSLYLPAGWFHEVTSQSKKDHYHMALNYWFHPPDKFDEFDCPYTDRDAFGTIR
jgi:hypothetical protein